MFTFIKLKEKDNPTFTKESQIWYIQCLCGFAIVNKSNPNKNLTKRVLMLKLGPPYFVQI